MVLRVGINGFGRIGRLVFRRLATDGIDVVGVNDLAPVESLAYLLEYDSVHGRYPGRVGFEEGAILVNGKRIPFLKEREPRNLPWGKLGADVVLESTGVFVKRAELAWHLEAGAKRVILSAPAKDAIDRTVVMGVNDHTILASDRILSNASCTTNCLAPLAKVLHESFGLRQGLVTTVHAYTANQGLIDTPSPRDLRRGRAAAVNVVPTSTGAARAVGKVLPDLEGRLNGLALRVPVPNGSLVDLVCLLDADPGAESANAALRAASEGSLAGILRYTDEPIVLQDIVGDPHSSIVDGTLTMRIEGGLYKFISWYDNEWAFSNRVVELIVKLGSL